MKIYFSLGNQQQIILTKNCPKDFEVPDQILPNLYLGSRFSETSAEYLKFHNITGVLIASHGEYPMHPDKFEYLFIDILDSMETDLIKCLEKATDFIQKHIALGGILVRCSAGVSRSPSIVIAYLIRFKKMSFDEAYGFVIKKRPLIDPNGNFINQLIIYEQLCKKYYIFYFNF